MLRWSVHLPRLKPVPLANERFNVMSETTIGLDHTEEAILVHEVSDEALEIASQTGKDRAQNFTLAFCSGISTCPS
jgi:hypothetical protein